MIGIARPNRFFAPWEFVDSLISLEGKYKIVTSNGSLIDENRNDLIYLARGDSWLLMVDTDMVFTPEDVATLVGHVESGSDIVCGVFRTSRPPHSLMLYKKGKFDYNPIEEVEKEVFEVDGCAMAFTIISGKVVDSIGHRPFYRLRLHEDLVPLGEDLSFCYRAKEKGFKIYCDPTVKVRHLVSKTV